MALLMVTYPITRFLIECLRNDEGAIFAGMTISQNGSVLLLLSASASGPTSAGCRRGRYADTAGPAEAPLATAVGRS